MDEAFQADEGGYILEPEWNEEELLQMDHAPVVPDQEPQLPDRMDELMSRMRGEVPVVEWCECGRCSVPQNPVCRMCVCCKEQDWLDQKITDEHVECITLHPSFEPVCLVQDVLEIAVLNMREVRGFGPQLEWNNRLSRYVSYRSYTYWIHRKLGRYNRKVIPACAVLAIRKTFSEPDGVYTSFKEADEIQEAWNL